MGPPSRPLDPSTIAHENWQIEYAKLLYTDFTTQIQRYLAYIQRTTFWGLSVLLGATGYLITNVKELPAAGKALLIAAVLLFGSCLVFTVLRAVRDLKTCARQVVLVDRFFSAFDVGRYLPGATIIPQGVESWGTKSWSEKHLWVPTVIMYALAAAIVILAILRTPSGSVLAGV